MDSVKNFARDQKSHPFYAMVAWRARALVLGPDDDIRMGIKKPTRSRGGICDGGGKRL